MRVFITGGSGCIGQAVVEVLVAEGHEVEVLVREGADAIAVSHIGAELRRGDLDQQFTARHARHDLGWVPRAPGVLEYLADSAVPA